MPDSATQEPTAELSAATRDMHRALVSLMEELDAIDRYNQRAQACHDPVLKAVLLHNGDEEKEHASMLLEWIRRSDKAFAGTLQEALFKTAAIAHH